MQNLLYKPDKKILLLPPANSWGITPRLNAHGITAAHFPLIVANSRSSNMQTDPLVLTDAEIAAILLRRL